MNLIGKKATAVALTTALALGGFSATNAEDSSDEVAILTAQLQALTAQLASLEGGSDTTTVTTGDATVTVGDEGATVTTGGATVTTTGSSTVVYTYQPLTAFEFTKNLYVGDENSDVLKLQKALNENPNTKVSDTGAGSPGNETNYFGPRTKQAVIKFQRMHGITPDLGYFYPITRGVMNTKTVIPAPAPDPTPDPTPTNNAPVVTITGDTEVTLTVGDSYTDEGATATDAEDGTLTVTTDGTVDTDTEGTYTITYTATDSQSATTTATRTVTVEAPEVIDELAVDGEATDDYVVGAGQKVLFSKLVLTAGTEDLEVKKIYVEADGSANDDVIDKVLLLDKNYTEIDDDNLNSDGEGDLKANLTVKAGESVTVYVGARLEAGTGSGDPIPENDGLDISLNVVNITTDGATVTGDSVSGASHEINEHIAVDTFSTDLAEEEGSAKVGENNVEFATITIDADGDSDVNVTSLKLERTGAAGDDAISDVKLTVNGDVYKATQDDDEYTFDFGEGISIDKGDDIDLTLTADIDEDAGKDVIFNVTDVVAMDNGVFLTSNTAGTSSLDIEAAQVVVSKNNNVKDEDVAAGSDSVSLASFDVEVDGEDVTGDIKVTLEINNVPAGTDTSDIDLSNVAIFKGSSAVTDEEDTDFTAITNGTQFEITFDDVEFKDEGDEVDYTIKADINSDTPTGTKYTVVKIEYVNIETESGDNVGDKTENLGQTQTVEGAVLEAEMKNISPAEISANSEDQKVANIELDASDSGDDIKVSKITLEYDDSAATKVDASEIENCELFDGTDSVSSRKDASASMKFSGLDITVAAGEKKTLTVKCDISDGATVITNNTIKFNGLSLESEGDTTNTNIDLDDAAFTGLSSANIVIPKLIASADSNTPDAQIVKKDSRDVVLGSFKVKADNGDATLEEVTIEVNDVQAINGDIDIYINGSKKTGKSETPTGGTAEIATLNVTAGPTVTGTDIVTLNGTPLNVPLTLGDNTIQTATKLATAINALPEYTADSAGSAVVTITAVNKGNQADITYNSVGSGATVAASVSTQGTNPVATFTNLSEDINDGSTAIVEFKADVRNDVSAIVAENKVITKVTGITYSDNVTTPNPSIATNIIMNPVTVVEAVPVVTQKTTGTNNTLTFGTSYESDKNILAFSIKADGDDLIVNSIKLNTNLAAGALKNAEVKVYSDSGLTNEEAISQLETSLATGDTTFTLTTPVTISDGDTFYFVLEADFAGNGTTGGKVELKDGVSDAIVFNPVFDISTVLDNNITATVNVNL